MSVRLLSNTGLLVVGVCICFVMGCGSADPGPGDQVSSGNGDGMSVDEGQTGESVTEPPKESTETTSITADAIAKAFAENSEAAEEKYAQKTVEVEGTVKSKAVAAEPYTVDLSGYDDGSGDVFSETIVTCEITDLEGVKPLRVDQTIKVRGTCFGKIVNSVFLRECEIVEVGEVPKDAPPEEEVLTEEEEQRREDVQAKAVEALTDLGVDVDDGFLGADVSIEDENLTPEGGIKPEILAELKNIYEFGDFGVANSAITDVGLADLAELKYLDDLELFRTEKITNDGLAHVGKMARLRSLKLEANPQLTDDGLAHLKELYALVYLSIQPDIFADDDERLQITDVGIAHLAGLKRIEMLTLHRTRMTDNGLASLANMAALSELDLQGALIEGPGLEHLSGLTKLKTVNLAGSNIGNDGLQHLAEVSSLGTLELEGTAIGDDGLAKLAGWKGDRLNLTGTKVTDAGIAHLAALPNLADLFLGDTEIGDGAAESLAKIENLDSLSLKGTKATDAGMEALANLPRLTWLKLTETEVGDAGLQHLAKVKTLENLYLSEEPKATEEGINKLKEALPELSVRLSDDF